MPAAIRGVGRAVLSSVQVPLGVSVGIDAVELQGVVEAPPSEHLAEAFGFWQVDWNFVLVSLTALFSAAATYVATSDAVRQHVRPEEYFVHKAADKSE